jgi:nucleoside-diphosphate-sugar epimerase
VRRALVTGATGGLGRALVDALFAYGYTVRATGRNGKVGEALEEAGATFVPADLTDPSIVTPLVDGCDVIFHAAAMSSPWGTPAAFQRINVEATRNLLAAAERTGCDGFVFISTPSVYSEPRDRVDLTEKSPLARRFANAYVATKHAAETLVRQAARPGLSTVCLRPRALIGPHDNVLLPRLLRVARTGRFPLFRGGHALIELTDVRDAAEAAVTADRRREALSGRVFNISGGAPASVADTLSEVFSTLGLKPRFVRLPYRLVAAACRVAEAACATVPGRPEPPATVYSISTLAFSQTFDLTAARADLGWRPHRTPEEAIARTARAWRDRAPL